MMNHKAPCGTPACRTHHQTQAGTRRCSTPHTPKQHIVARQRLLTSAITETVTVLWMWFRHKIATPTIPRPVGSVGNTDPNTSCERRPAMRPVVFLDTETTRKDADRRPWEIAMIRRDDTGEKSLTLFIDPADLDLDHADPTALAIGGFHQRHPAFGTPLHTGQQLCSAAQAAALVRTWTARARVYGVVPSFDTECLAAMLARHGVQPTWHYQPWDVAVLATGYLLGRGMQPGYSSEENSRLLDVALPAPDERHTALADAAWAGRIYDKILEGRCNAWVAA